MHVYQALSQNIVFFHVFLLGYGKQQALQLGRMWQELKDPGKKAKCAVFCGSDQAAGKCFERGRYMTVLNLFHFHKFSDLILLKT